MKRLVAVCGLALVAGCHSNQAAPAIPQATFISPKGANHAGARFSPDGKRLFWWAPAAGGWQLWTAKADLSDSTALPVNAIDPTFPLLWSPDGSQIALAVSGASGSLANVAVMSSAGGTARVLVGGSNLSIPVGWNPDGDRLAYGAFVASQSGATIQGLETSLSHGGARPLIPGESRPYAGMWSPDGSHMAFVVFAQGRPSVWVADSDGSKPRQLTSEGFEGFDRLAVTPFSPDGKQLAYSSTRTGTKDVWVVGIDGSPPRQLTRDIRNDYSPIWSPDGRWIAFLSDRGRQTDIWVVPSAGGIEQRVTNDPAPEDLIGWVAGTDRLAFLTGVGASSIWSMSLADGTARQLTPDSIRTSCCDISPDGTQLLFGIKHGAGSDQLAVMPVAGGAWRIVGELSSANPTYSWSPDGSQIAFVSDEGGTDEIWVAPGAGGTSRQLTNWAEGTSNPNWNADGSMLYFVSPHDSRLGDVWRVPVAGGPPVRVTTEGAISGIMHRRGRPELFATAAGASGAFNTVRVAPDGSISTVWSKGNSFPAILWPHGDSLLIAEIGAGGALGHRLIPVDGHGDGQLLLKPGESAADLSPDGKALLYYVPAGANNNLSLLDRTTGATRVLSTTPDSKSGAGFTPDGKTVIFVRSHDVRRIAIADLTKLLATSTVKPH
jgi:Tol biopolymer transport system component